ncbi:hypothetical protein H0E87_017730 [Populus deltoides]|uniref:Glabrous enhancer-binding protein-like DBD domain-containing protein n=1 Tax=Populus deltoides TaxID=3696 RepID=A0A8T2Y1H4_POPDE|nr:hypothetical protein H0E87_017730 [Populus deltoides]
MAAEQDDTVFDQDLEVDDEDDDDQSSQSQNDDLEDDLEIENDDTLPENDDVLSEELLEDDDTSTSAAVTTASISAVTTASIPAVTTTTTTTTMVATDSTLDASKRQRVSPETTVLSQDSKNRNLMIPGGTANHHHNDTALFYDQIKSKLQLDFNKNQLVEKLRRLKKKYRNVLSKINSGKDFCFKSPHDQATFEISRKIWSSTGKIAGFSNEDGNNLDDDDGGNPNYNNHTVMMDGDVVVKIEDHKSTPRSRKRSRSRSVGVKMEENRVLNDGFVGNETNVTGAGAGGGGGGGDGNGNVSSVIEETMRSCLSPLFKELSSSMAGAGMGGVGRGVGRLAMNAMPLSFGAGDAMMMDEKWRKQHILELEVYSKRLELVQDQIRAQLNELRSMGD